MSKPLPVNCTDFEAFSFFKECKNQIRRIAQESKLQKTISKTIAKVEQLRSDKTENLDRMLLFNIVIDFIRSFNFNYSYPVFLRQANVISEQIASKTKLADLIGISDQLANDERLNVSLVELMVKKIQTCTDKTKQLIQCGSQIDIINRAGTENNALLMENKVREIRQQVERRQKKYYEKQLENMRAKQIMQLRIQINKQAQQRYNRQKTKLNDKFQELIAKARSNQNFSKLKEQNDKLLNKNYQLTDEVSKVKKQLQGIRIDNVRHDCTKHPDYLKLMDAAKKERKELEEKKKELDYALRNINTKVEDLIMQKRKVQGEKKTDVFQQQIKINRQNKDHMIEVISGEMKHMCNRVKVLDDQNKMLRQNLKEMIQKLKQKENENMKIQKQLHKQDLNENQAIQSNKTISKYRDDNARTINPYDRNRKELKGAGEKPQKVSVCVGVSETDLNEFNLPEQSKISSESESESGYDQFEDKQLEHDKKLAEIKANMNIIKKKVLFLVDNEI